MLKSQLHEMLKLQDTLNTVVDPVWRDDPNRNDSTAMIMEASELIGHLGFKWWKKETPDFAQAQMEFVDIWHFLMSDIIREFPAVTISELTPECELFDNLLGVFTRKVDQISNIPEAGQHAARIRVVTAFIMGVAASDVQMNLATHSEESSIEVHEATEVIAGTFATMMNCLNIDSNQLYKWYIGKNALNHFRQANGYKEGTYIKMWNCQEDNERLTDILELVTEEQLSKGGLFDHVLAELTQDYKRYALKTA